MGRLVEQRERGRLVRHRDLLRPRRGLCELTGTDRQGLGDDHGPHAGVGQADLLLQRRQSIGQQVQGLHPPGGIVLPGAHLQVHGSTVEGDAA